MKLITSDNGVDFDFIFEAGDRIAKISPRGFANEVYRAIVLTDDPDTSVWDDDPNAWAEIETLTPQRVAQMNFSRRDLPLLGRYESYLTPLGYASGEDELITVGEVRAWLKELEGE